MLSLRTSVPLLLCATVLVQAYSDYYPPMGTSKRTSSMAKYATTMLTPPKMNRNLYRPSAKHYGGKMVMMRPTAGAYHQLQHYLSEGDIISGGHLVAYSKKKHSKKLSQPYGKRLIAKIPIKSKHMLKYRHYPLKPGYGVYGIGEHELPAIVEVNAKSVPLSLVFRSSSSKINIQQSHDSTYAKQYGGPRQTYSVDEPHILRFLNSSF